jgi:hypothetical protein
MASAGGTPPDGQPIAAEAQRVAATSQMKGEGTDAEPQPERFSTMAWQQLEAAMANALGTTSERQLHRWMVLTEQHPEMHAKERLRCAKNADNEGRGFPYPGGAAMWFRKQVTGAHRPEVKALCKLVGSDESEREQYYANSAELTTSVFTQTSPIVFPPPFTLQQSEAKLAYYEHQQPISQRRTSKKLAKHAVRQQEWCNNLTRKKILDNRQRLKVRIAEQRLQLQAKLQRRERLLPVWEQKFAELLEEYSSIARSLERL